MSSKMVAAVYGGWYHEKITIMGKMNLYHLIIAGSIWAAAIPLLAADTGSELHIYRDGSVYLTGALLERRHALNLYTVLVWRQRWTVMVNDDTEILAKDGKRMGRQEILQDHLLEVKGKSVEGQLGSIEADIIRDTSVETGSGPLGSLSPPTSAALFTAPIPLTSSIHLPTVASASLSAGTSSKITAAEPEKGEGSSGLSTQPLRLGMRGGAVIVLQEFLQKNGWGIPDDGPVTGYFGKVTRDALMKFQEAKGLPAIGTLGPKTRDLINSLMRSADPGARNTGALASRAPDLPSKILEEKPPLAQKKEAARKITLMLSLGTQGPEVSILQEFLQKNNWGVPDDGPVTGFFGGVTKKALIKFQEANGLEATGETGPLTRKLINAALAQ